MLSIIICSYRNDLFEHLSSNISFTIGIQYEIIQIDNSKKQYGICDAYNLGASRSKYDYLCFCHEDILFHTQNWGKKVIEYLTIKDIGLLGVAGSTIKTKFPSPWWLTPDELSTKRINLIQHKNGGKEIEHELINPFNEKISDVVVLDGVWLCCRKNVWNANPFDSKNFSNFHFYDMDFSMQIFQKLKVCVTFEVLIEHFSRGNYPKIWIENAIQFSKKWKNILPVTIYFDKTNMNRYETEAKYFLFERIINSGFPKTFVLKTYFISLFSKPLDKRNLSNIKKLIRELVPYLKKIKKTVKKK